LEDWAGRDDHRLAAATALDVLQDTAGSVPDLGVEGGDDGVSFRE